MTVHSRRAMTPQDITRIRFISDPQLSPDGRRVAFVVTMLSEDQDEYLSNIWVVDTTGGEPRRFTTGPKRDTAPRWSPDGSRLAFVSERVPKQKAQLYVMPADGGEPMRLTDLRNGVAHPVWSPDSTRLALVSRVGGWQEPEDEAERQKSKPARVITSLKYKYNGEGFTYDRRPHIFVVSAEGGPPQQLTDGDFVDADPAWAPDGSAIAFTSARHEERDYDNAADVWLIPATGGEPRRLTDTAGPVSLPVFSPDGRTIAFLGHRYRHDAGRNMRVFTVPLPAVYPPVSPWTWTAPVRPFLPAWRRSGPQTVPGSPLPSRIRGTCPSTVSGLRDGTLPERIITGERQVTGLVACTGRLPMRLYGHGSGVTSRGIPLSCRWHG